jgi:hypothetical protein
VTEEWRKLHNEELRDLYSSPNIIRIMKLRIMRLAGHVARIGLKVIPGKARMRETTREVNMYVGGWITLRWILERSDGVVWTGLVWLGIGTGRGLLWML